MSTAPTTPGLSLETLFGGLDPDQIIADEEEDLTLPVSILGKRTAPPGQISNGNDDDDEENGSPDPEGRDLQGRSGPATQINTGTLQIEQIIRRTAKRLRLSHESTSLVEQFSQESSLEVQLTLLYGNTVAIRDELAELRRSVGTSSYQISEELEENIKKYTRLVLLSPSISHYKGPVPKEYLTQIISKYRFGIPPNIEANGYAWGKITARIEHELTQARSQLKKVLKRDAGIEDVRSRNTIYQLAKAMLSDDSHKITPGICARVALMRQAYTLVSDATFWDEVDKVLDSINSMEEEKRIQYLKAVLNRDRKTYGVAPGTTAAAPDSATMGRDDESPIQRLVEDVIGEPSGGATF